MCGPWLARAFTHTWWSFKCSSNVKHHNENESKSTCLYRYVFYSVQSYFNDQMSESGSIMSLWPLWSMVNSVQFILMLSVSDFDLPWRTRGEWTCELTWLYLLWYTSHFWFCRSMLVSHRSINNCVVLCIIFSIYKYI